MSENQAGKLTPMQFRDFVWPNNPHTYSIQYRRLTAALKYPSGTYCLQDLGRTYRIMEGEGEFFGADAYQTFGQLANTFYAEKSGILRHPVWQDAEALLVQLELTQKPLADYVAYRFTFYEMPTVPASVGAAEREKTVTLAQGQTLWSLCESYQITMQALLEKNPDIANPSEAAEGRTVSLP